MINDWRTVFLNGRGIVLFVKKLLKEFKDLFTLLYIFDKIGCKDRSSEKGIPNKYNKRP